MMQLFLFIQTNHSPSIEYVEEINSTWWPSVPFWTFINPAGSQIYANTKVRGKLLFFLSRCAVEII
jgi:hypothetical protein